MIFAIDPGNEESAYVVVSDDLSLIVDKGKVDNHKLAVIIEDYCMKTEVLTHVAIEMIASYGMAVGKTVFETCVWIGEFKRLFRDNGFKVTYIYRKDEKMCLCNSMKAKDANIRQALIDRFGDVGTKKNPGYFYGFKKDIWAAMSVAVSFHDMYLTKEGKEI